jgi:hypothetical protein
VPSRTLILAVLLLAGCSSKDKKSDSRSNLPSPDSASTPETEAAILGREVYGLVDQAMSYKSSHRGRLPRSLRELGIDELTRSTSRTLTANGGEVAVQVEFRNLASHTLRSCRGTSAMLEDASISGGDFSVSCLTTTGGSMTLRARR